MAQSPRKETHVSSRNSFIVGRFGIILLICVVLAAAITFFLVRTVTFHAAAWNSMADSTLTKRDVIDPVRGDILASDGSILATNLYYYNVRLDLRAESFEIMAFIDTIPMLSDTLAAYFPTRTRDEWEAHLRAGISVMPKSRRSRGWSIAKKVPLEVAEKVRRFPFFRGWKNSAHTGLVIERELVRSYPFGRMASLSVGRVGQTAYDSRVIGRSGLECSLDSLLYGIPGVKKRKLGTRGTYMAVDTPAVDGYDITTTIDISMQDILESELGEMLLASNADWGTAMLMEVKTGDIKALANLERDSTAATPTYIAALNRIVDAYEPGSVMKVMTMAVALRHGYANLDQNYSIGHSYAYLGRKPITDTHSPATLPVRRFMEYSSNIGMAKLSMPQYENNPNLFRERLADMGFFDRLNTSIARERKPYFPTLQNNVGGRLSLSRMVFGYSTMIPPLYTCAFYNAIANDGKFVRPRLVKKLRDPSGRDSIIPVTYVRDSILSPAQARVLREMMHDVVWGEGGTAKSLKNSTVEIAGKTGTCKLALEDNRPRFDAQGNRLELTPWRGGYMEGHYRVTFCGFFPYENPKYTCIVVISDPKIPYRGPAVSSGTVLKNTALKMFARGMLEDDPVFMYTPDATEHPILHAAFDENRINVLATDLHLGGPRVIRRPQTDFPAGQVPDVKGVNLREALARLEAAGYAVDFSGSGYVASQTPEAGITAPPGTRVHLGLQNMD